MHEKSLKGLLLVERNIRSFVSISWTLNYNLVLFLFRAEQDIKTFRIFWFSYEYFFKPNDTLKAYFW